jgi:diguanylate cyclase (GGDEF)-like protein
MKLDESIEQLEKLITQLRDASLADDKTVLGSALALTREGRRISEGTSNLEVVVFGDLNRFKELNDDHSHDAGDVAINQTGQVIHTLISEISEARAFRQSGDEFVILLERGSLSQPLP